MSKASLKKKIREYIDSADDKILIAVYTLLEEHSKVKEQQESYALDKNDIAELDKRWAEYKKGKTKVYSPEEINAEISRRLKEKR